MADEALAALVAKGTLESVAGDAALAQIELGDAKQHRDSVELLLPTDPVLAYTALYDATRKAIAAHMRARGFRVRGKTGYHAKIMEYAEVVLAAQGIETHVERLEEMRTIRNDTEYRGRRVGRVEVEADL